MGFITDTLRGVIKEGKDAAFGAIRSSDDGSRARRSNDGSRQRTSNNGSSAGYSGYVPGHDHASGPGLPPPHPSGEAPQHASAADVAQAYGLVESAVADLKQAVETLHKQSGIIAAAKAMPADGWKEAGKTIAHDGRFPAKQLCESAMTKYEQAAQLVVGIPELETTPEIQEGRLTEAARAIGGTAGTGALAAAFAGAQITTAVLVGFTPVGLIKKAVKKKRSKQAAANVTEMLNIMEGVRQQLEHLHRRGVGGFIEVHAAPHGNFPQASYPQAAQGYYPQAAQGYYPQGAQGYYPQGAQGYPGGYQGAPGHY